MKKIYTLNKRKFKNIKIIFTINSIILYIVLKEKIIFLFTKNKKIFFFLINLIIKKFSFK